MRQTAFTIIIVVGVVSLFVGLSLVGTLYNQIAPQWYFGASKAREQHIRIVENGRHYLRFSNNPSATVPKSALGSLNLMAGFARFVAIISIFYGLVFITVQVVKRWDTRLADEVWLVARGKRPASLHP